MVCKIISGCEKNQPLWGKWRENLAVESSQCIYSEITLLGEIDFKLHVGKKIEVRTGGQWPENISCGKNNYSGVSLYSGGLEMN